MEELENNTPKKILRISPPPGEEGTWIAYRINNQTFSAKVHEQPLTADVRVETLHEYISKEYVDSLIREATYWEHKAHEIDKAHVESQKDLAKWKRLFAGTSNQESESLKVLDWIYDSSVGPILGRNYDTVVECEEDKVDMVIHGTTVNMDKLEAIDLARRIFDATRSAISHER